MMLALWPAVTVPRPRRAASSKANRTIRSLPDREIAFTEMPLSRRIRTSVISSMKAIRRSTSTVPTSNSTPV